MLQRQCSKLEKSFRLGFIVLVLPRLWSFATAELWCVRIRTCLMRCNWHISSGTRNIAGCQEQQRNRYSAVVQSVTWIMWLGANVKAIQHDTKFYVVNFMLQGPCILEWNCVLTNVMHKFLIYLSIYFCLTCSGLSLSPSSEAGVQLRQWFKLKLYTCLWRWAKRKPWTCNAEVNTRR
jgi:hypothetical protein